MPEILTEELVNGVRAIREAGGEVLTNVKKYLENKAIIEKGAEIKAYIAEPGVTHFHVAAKIKKDTGLTVPQFNDKYAKAKEAEANPLTISVKPVNVPVEPVSVEPVIVPPEPKTPTATISMPPKEYATVVPLLPKEPNVVISAEPKVIPTSAVIPEKVLADFGFNSLDEANIAVLRQSEQQRQQHLPPIAEIPILPPQKIIELGQGYKSLHDDTRTDIAETQKVIRLIDYLTRLASLRTKIIRNIDEYQNVLWVKDIPLQKGCFTQAWGHDEDYDADVWIEVQTRREPELPSVPPLCKEWVEKSFLRNKSDLPELFPEITMQINNPNWSEESGQPEFIPHTKRLKDHPEVQRTWNRYVEDKWLPWTEEHNAWERVHKVYSALFVIHQEQIRLGEEYELVLGLELCTGKGYDRTK